MERNPPPTGVVSGPFSASLVRRYFADQNPLGKRLYVPNEGGAQRVKYGNHSIGDLGSDTVAGDQRRLDRTAIVLTVGHTVRSNPVPVSNLCNALWTAMGEVAHL